MPTLKEILSETINLDQQLEAAGGELTPELEEYLNSISEDMVSKIDNYGLYMRKMSAEIASTKELIKDMQSVLKAKENNLKHLKDHLAYTMKHFGYPKLQGQTCSVSLQETTSTEVDELTMLAPFNDKLADIQDQFPSWVKLSASVNKTALKESYPEGSELPSGMKYNKNTSIRIR